MQYTGIEDAWVKLLNAFGIYNRDDATSGSNGLKAAFSVANKKLAIQAAKHGKTFPAIDWDDRVQKLDNLISTSLFDKLTSENVKTTETTDVTLNVLKFSDSMIRLLTAKAITYGSTKDPNVLRVNERFFDRLVGCMGKGGLLNPQMASMAANIKPLCSDPTAFIGSISQKFANAEPYPISGMVDETNHNALTMATMKVHIPSIDRLDNVVYVAYLSSAPDDLDIKITRIITDSNEIEEIRRHASKISKTDRDVDISQDEDSFPEDDIAMAHLAHTLTLLSDVGLVSTVIQPTDGAHEGVIGIIGAVSVANWIVYYHKTYNVVASEESNDETEPSEPDDTTDEAPSAEQPVQREPTDKRVIKASFNPNKFAK